MKKFRLLEVIGSSSGIYIYTSDSQTINVLLRELKKFIPQFKVDWKEGLEKGQIKGCFVYMLRGKNDQVESWLLDKLCEYGWEPYAIYETVDRMGMRYPARCFRQGVESQPQVIDLQAVSENPAKPFNMDDVIEYIASN